MVVKTLNLPSKRSFIIVEHSRMPLEADAADAWSLPKGSRARADGWAKLLQTNNYPSWSQSQEVTSTTSVNNSLQGLIKVPCRKFFLSSQLSLSCCPVSPNGWVAFPTPRPWSQRPRVKKRTGTACILSSESLPHWAAATLLEPWQPGWRPLPSIPTQTMEASLQPEGSPRAPGLPIPGTGCCALRKLCLPGLFLSYFMHPDGHSGQDLRNSYPFALKENGKVKIYYPPR